MTDLSRLDAKYFIDRYVYNCPYCNRRNISYWVSSSFRFDWTESKPCKGFLVECASCRNTSFHLTFEDVSTEQAWITELNAYMYRFDYDGDLDDAFFYSVPTSFFVTDQRIPVDIRELVTEADGCLKMNFLTGASACARKAIYELLEHQGAEGDSYEGRIKSLAEMHPDVDPVAFELLSHIQSVTSDKVHEQSWPAWDSGHLQLVLTALRNALHDIYVLPEEKKDRWEAVRRLREKVTTSGAEVAREAQDAEGEAESVD